jgi:hypothetical protein
LGGEEGVWVGRRRVSNEGRGRGAAGSLVRRQCRLGPRQPANSTARVTHLPPFSATPRITRRAHSALRVFSPAAMPCAYKGGVWAGAASGADARRCNATRRGSVRGCTPHSCRAPSRAAPRLAVPPPPSHLVVVHAGLAPELALAWRRGKGAGAGRQASCGVPTRGAAPTGGAVTAAATTASPSRRPPSPWLMTGVGRAQGRRGQEEGSAAGLRTAGSGVGTRRASCGGCAAAAGAHAQCPWPGSRHATKPQPPLPSDPALLPPHRRR